MGIVLLFRLSNSKFDIYVYLSNNILFFTSFFENTLSIVYFLHDPFIAIHKAANHFTSICCFTEGNPNGL